MLLCLKTYSSYSVLNNQTWGEFTDESNGSSSCRGFMWIILLLCSWYVVEWGMTQKIKMSGSITKKKKIKGKSIFRQKECQHWRPAYTMVVKWKWMKAVPRIYCKTLRREWCFPRLSKQRSVAWFPRHPNLEIWVIWMLGYLCFRAKISETDQICVSIAN